MVSIELIRKVTLEFVVTFFASHSRSWSLDTRTMANLQPPMISEDDVKVFEDVLMVSEMVSIKVKLIKMKGGSVLVHVCNPGVDTSAIGLSNLTLSIGNQSTNIRNSLQVNPLSLSKAISNKCNKWRPVYLSFNLSETPGTGSDTVPLISSAIVKFVSKCLQD